MLQPPATTATILIIDDQESNLRLLERVLISAGYQAFVSSTDPLKAVDLYRQYRPDLVVLDLHMPMLDGIGVLERLNEHMPEGTYVPVLVITGDLSPTTKQRALSAGAKDFLGKPFDPLEVVLRIKNLLEARSLYVELQRQNEVLEEKVAQRRYELEDAQLEILERLGRTAEFRDDDTMQHTQRVGAISARIAEALGLPDDLVKTLRLAAPLHDIGKIGVPDNILLKLGKLTQDEYDVIKTHTAIGARILSGSTHLLLQMAEQIALTHHERWDGHGYIGGLRGEEIPLVSRIVAVADVFDALTHQRPYKDPWPVDDAIREIEHQSGSSSIRRSWRRCGRSSKRTRPGRRPDGRPGRAAGPHGQSQATRLPTGDESAPRRGRTPPLARSGLAGDDGHEQLTAADADRLEAGLLRERLQFLRRRRLADVRRALGRRQPGHLLEQRPPVLAQQAEAVHVEAPPGLRRGTLDVAVAVPLLEVHEDGRAVDDVDGAVERCRQAVAGQVDQLHVAGGRARPRVAQHLARHVGADPRRQRGASGRRHGRRRSRCPGRCRRGEAGFRDDVSASTGRRGPTPRRCRGRRPPSSRRSGLRHAVPHRPYSRRSATLTV